MNDSIIIFCIDISILFNTLYTSGIKNYYVIVLFNIIIFFIGIVLAIRNNIKFKMLDIIVFVFFIWICFDSYIVDGNYKYIAFSLLALFNIYFLVSKNVHDLKKVMLNTFKFYIFMMILISLFGDYCFIFNKQLFFNGNYYGIDSNFFNTRAITSVFLHPNGFGLTCSYSIIMSWLIFNIIDSNKKIYFCNIIFQTINIILSGSRASIVIVIIFLCLYYGIRNIKKMLIITTLLAIVGIIFLKVGSNYFSSNILFIKLASNDKLSSRNFIWNAAFDVIKNNILLGVGSENYIKQIGDYLDKNALIGIGVHNGYLNLIVNYGIIALGSMIMICFNIIHNSYILHKSDDDNMNIGIVLFFIALLFYNLVESNFIYEMYIYNYIFWLVLSFASICNNNNVAIYRKNKMDSN